MHNAVIQLRNKTHKIQKISVKYKMSNLKRGQTDAT